MYVPTRLFCGSAIGHRCVWRLTREDLYENRLFSKLATRCGEPSQQSPIACSITRNEPVKHLLFHTRLLRSLALSFQKVSFRQVEAVLAVDGAPYARGRFASVGGVPFWVFDQIDVASVGRLLVFHNAKVLVGPFARFFRHERKAIVEDGGVHG